MRPVLIEQQSSTNDKFLILSSGGHRRMEKRVEVPLGVFRLLGRCPGHWSAFGRRRTLAWLVVIHVGARWRKSVGFWACVPYSTKYELQIRTTYAKNIPIPCRRPRAGRFEFETRSLRGLLPNGIVTSVAFFTNP